MLIRNKLLLAASVPILLLVCQVLLVNYFVRELQLAVQFIGNAQNVIEADLRARDLVTELQTQVKRVPQSYVQSNTTAETIDSLWQEIKDSINLIDGSPVVSSVDNDSVLSVSTEFGIAANEIINIQQLLSTESPDMNTLLVQAISANGALDDLDTALSDLALQLRHQLKLAVEREREIHNRPTIAGVAIGGLAVTLLTILVWVFVDKGIGRRLTRLSQSMLRIAGGDLHTAIPLQNSVDELGQMSQALTIFRDNAIEIRERDRREVIQKRKQRQYWLEHMASFLRHEVKNKQVGAEQSIRLLASREGQNIQVSKYCDRAISSLVDMKELINSTVDAADIETALISEDFESLEIGKLVQDYTEKAEYHFGTSIIYINKTKERSLIKGDAQRLEQMLDKLVSNAIDFKTADTDITIRLSMHDLNYFALSVENKGSSLREDTDTLFQLSYTSRPQKIKQQGNVGFGLFVAHRIAEYHNGSIDAANTDDGVVFTVFLPVQSEA